MAAPKATIELLPQEEWEKKSVGKFLKWTLTIGRYIVITTELVVILAFLSRFKLDRDLTNLNEKIKQQQAIINSSAEFEQDFRFLQKRLTTIESLKRNQLEAGTILLELSTLTPIDIAFADLSIAKNEVSLTATALSEAGLATFLKNLQSSSRFASLTVSQLTTGEIQGLGMKFRLTSKLGAKE